MDKRPCGIYRTTRPIPGSIGVDALVFYHNHGDPGPGVYLPVEWRHNRAVFDENGTTVPDASYAHSLVPLRPEGLYRVAEPFYCCELKCQHYEEDQLVQLGYNSDAEAILFVPEFSDDELLFPEEGTYISDEQLECLAPLKVFEAEEEELEGEVEPEMLN